MEYDRLLEVAGSFGLYQKLLCDRAIRLLSEAQISRK
jgi:hypothetical protein